MSNSKLPMGILSANYRDIEVTQDLVHGSDIRCKGLDTVEPCFLTLLYKDFFTDEKIEIGGDGKDGLMCKGVIAKTEVIAILLGNGSRH